MKSGVRALFFSKRNLWRSTVRIQVPRTSVCWAPSPEPSQPAGRRPLQTVVVGVWMLAVLMATITSNLLHNSSNGWLECGRCSVLTRAGHSYEDSAWSVVVAPDWSKQLHWSLRFCYQPLAVRKQYMMNLLSASRLLISAGQFLLT